MRTRRHRHSQHGLLLQARYSAPERAGGGHRSIGRQRRSRHRGEAGLRQARAVHGSPPSSAHRSRGRSPRSVLPAHRSGRREDPYGHRPWSAGGDRRRRLYRTRDSGIAARTGLQVTVLEATARVLERVTAAEVSTFFERIHREQEVDIRTNAMVEGLSGDREVREVSLASGESIPADLVIVGVGVEPNTTSPPMRVLPSTTAS